MAGKRKRADNVEEGEEGGVNGSHGTQQLETFHGWLIDVLILLRAQDTSPSTFDRPITTTAQGVHDTKRAKLTDLSEKTTIATLVDTRAYATIEEIISDLENATASITEDLQEAAKREQGHYISQELHAEITRATCLNRELDRLIQRETLRRPDTIIRSGGIKDEPSEEEDLNIKLSTAQDNVLTLLSSNQPPKQLFTSLRKPSHSNHPLNELALPNGITTAKVTPQHSLNEDGKKPAPTFKDVFAPPLSLPPLTLPKQSRHTATRSSSVNWYNPAETEPKSKPSRHDGYTKQLLTTGQWLKYSVAPSSTQLASPETKRKQRDRALSVGEPETSLSPGAIETQNQAKEDALFRSVYSSFAPVKDDFGAIVPERHKDRMWWKKYGERRYQEILDLRDDGATENEVMQTNSVADEDQLDEDELTRAIANWQPEGLPEEMKESSHPKNAPNESARETDELLEEISDLLETLHSHQRIRNLALANNSRSASAQTPQSTDTNGRPTSPSAAEFEIYETLKSQLALIISTLPPYLLSKLDGDKLGALQISTKVQVESKNQKGVLEESEASAIARRSATPSTVPASASQTPSAYSNIPGRNNSYIQASTPAQQYPRAGYGPPSTSRAAGNGSYLQNPQYSNRPASSNYPSSAARPSNPAQGGYTPQGAAAASAPRYNYAQQYGQQQTQSSYGAYQNGYRPYSNQNMNNYNYNGQLSASQGRTPSNPSQASKPAYLGPASDYQQRAVPPQGYGYGSTQGSGAQGTTQQRPPLYHQHSSQYSAQTPGSPQVNGTASSASPAPQGHTTADEQVTAITKQKAHLAEGQSRQGSGTPQPGSRQYSPHDAEARQNGTPIPQQNGIMAGQA